MISCHKKRYHLILFHTERSRSVNIEEYLLAYQLQLNLAFFETTR